MGWCLEGLTRLVCSYTPHKSICKVLMGTCPALHPALMHCIYGSVVLTNCCDMQGSIGISVQTFQFEVKTLYQLLEATCIFIRLYGLLNPCS